MTSHEFWLVMYCQTRIDWLVGNMSVCQENLVQSKSEKTSIFLHLLNYLWEIFYIQIHVFDGDVCDPQSWTSLLSFDVQWNLNIIETVAWKYTNTYQVVCSLCLSECLQRIYSFGEWNWYLNTDKSLLYHRPPLPYLSLSLCLKKINKNC